MVCNGKQNNSVKFGVQWFLGCSAVPGCSGVPGFSTCQIIHFNCIQPARKIKNELITSLRASGVINLQSKHDLICHAAKMKAAKSLSKAIFRVVVISLPMT